MREKERNGVTRFIKNLNKYMLEMKIKQTYLSMISGIDKDKLFRLLTGQQEESGTDMEKIAGSLGKNAEFFLTDSCNVPQIGCFSKNKMVFYAEGMTGKKEKNTEQIMELIENIDEVLSAKSRFDQIAEE